MDYAALSCKTPMQIANRRATPLVVLKISVEEYPKVARFHDYDFPEYLEIRCLMKTEMFNDGA